MSNKTTQSFRQLLHDPDVYVDPLTFNPERFLGERPERDPREIVFGFGRRICPGDFALLLPKMTWRLLMRLVGLNLADAAVFMTVAQTLSVFEVSKKVRDGIVIEPDCEYEAGTVRCVTSLPAFLARLVLKSVS